MKLRTKRRLYVLGLLSGLLSASLFGSIYFLERTIDNLGSEVAAKERTRATVQLNFDEARYQHQLFSRLKSQDQLLTALNASDPELKNNMGKSLLRAAIAISSNDYVGTGLGAAGVLEKATADVESQSLHEGLDFEAHYLGGQQRSVKRLNDLTNEKRTLERKIDRHVSVRILVVSFGLALNVLSLVFWGMVDFPSAKD